MRTKTFIPLLLLAATLIVISALTWAGATCQIKGTVTDKETRQPVVGASVLIVGTTRGAMTNADGKFVISQLEPGIYTLRITRVHYQTVEVTDVNVTSDLVTEVSVSLEKKTAELEKIVVSAECDAIDRREVSSSQTIEMKPVTTVQD